MITAHSAHEIKSLPSAARWLWHLLDACMVFEIYGTILLFTSWAAVIVAIYKYVDERISINNSLLSVLGVLLSFSISLRVSSGHGQYTAGRQCWTNLGKAMRDFAMLVSLHVLPATEGDEEAEMKLLLEKRAALNILTAFPVAAKHALRHEAGVFYTDLFPLIAHLPKFSGLAKTEADVAVLWRAVHPDSGRYCVPDVEQGMSTAWSSRSSTLASKLNASAPSVLLTEKMFSKAEAQGEGGSLAIELEPGFNPPKRTAYDFIPLLYLFRPLAHFVFRISRTDQEEAAHRAHKLRKTRRFLTSNVPLEISLYLSNFVSSLHKRGLIDAMYTGQLFTALSLMNDSFANMDRVESTPLPFSYAFHLQAVTAIYLLLAPFFLCAQFGWLSLMAVAVTSFFFYGFLRLGANLEGPFGYDDVDLPLDALCRAFAVDVAEIAAHAPHDTSALFEDPANRPFIAAGDLRTAQQIFQQHSEDRVAHLRRDFSKHYEQQRLPSKLKHKGPHTRVEVKTVGV